MDEHALRTAVRAEAEARTAHNALRRERDKQIAQATRTNTYQDVGRVAGMTTTHVSRIVRSVATGVSTSRIAKHGSPAAKGDTRSKQQYGSPA